MKVMILAAGKGERMRPLTEHTPKPLLPVHGKALLQYHLEKLASAGLCDIVINHAYLGEQIEAYFGKGEALGLNIHYSPEGEPLETAGGIIKALPLLGKSSFIVINGDIWTDYSFADLPQLDGSRNLAHLVMVENPEHHPQGDFFLSETGRLCREESSDLKRLTYSGIAVYHPALFAGLPQGKRPLLPILQTAIDAGQISGEYYQGEWLDIGTVERLRALEQKLAARA